MTRDAKGRPFRHLRPHEVQPYINAVPLYSLAAAVRQYSATGDFDAEATERFEWVGLDRELPADELFVARIDGAAMDRKVPSGSWCLFRATPNGRSRGAVVLARHPDFKNPENEDDFGLRIIEHEVDSASGRRRVVLRPDTDRDGFEPVTFEGAAARKLQVVAELVEVLG